MPIATCTIDPAAEREPIPFATELPSSWEIFRLDRLFRLRKELPQPTDEVVTAFIDGRVTLRRNVKAEGIKNAILEQGWQRVHTGDLMISGMNGHLGGLGISDATGKCSPIYLVLRPTQNFNERFLSYFLRLTATSGWIKSILRTIRFNSADLKYDDLKLIRVPVPLRTEQDAIVAYLDWKLEAIDRYLRVKEREIALLEERKRALIHRAVTRGLDPNPKLQPSGIPWLPEIPAGWEAWKIGHLARVGNGSTPARSQPSYWAGGTYPWLNSASVNQGTITESDQFVTPTALRECHLPIVPRHSVLVAITGQGKTRGTAALLELEATINQHVAFITISDPRLVPRYLHLALRGLYAQLRAMSDDSGSTKGALTCHDLKHLKIPIPPKKLQLMIVGGCNEEVERIDTTITRARHQIERMQEYRTALIAEAVTGKITLTAAS